MTQFTAAKFQKKICQSYIVYLFENPLIKWLKHVWNRENMFDAEAV